MQDNAPRQLQCFLTRYTIRYKMVFQRMRKIPDAYNKQLETTNKQQRHIPYMSSQYIAAEQLKCKCTLYDLIVLFNVDNITMVLIIVKLHRSTIGHYPHYIHSSLPSIKLIHRKTRSDHKEHYT